MGDIAVYDGTDWCIVYPFPEIVVPQTGADVQIATTAPAPRGVGDMWIDSDDTVLTWDSTWTTPTLVNGWVVYAAGYEARYRKLINGMVTVEGLVKNGTSGLVTTLPAGYRPGKKLLWASITDANIFCRLDVATNGQMVLSGYTANSWASINCNFYAEL